MPANDPRFKDIWWIHEPRDVEWIQRIDITAGAATLAEVAFRFREDDQSDPDNGTVWYAIQDTNASIDVDTDFCIRFRLDETESKAWGPFSITPEYRHVQGTNTWTAVTATSSVVRASSGVGGAPTLTNDSTVDTHRLTGGTGTQISGTASTDGDLTESTGKGEIIEIEFCVFIRSADVSDGDDIDLRCVSATGVIVNLGTPPQVNAVAGAAPQNVTAVAAVASWEGVATTPVPGAVSKAAVAAGASWEGVATVPTGGPVTKAALAATGVWEAVPVESYDPVFSDCVGFWDAAHYQGNGPLLDLSGNRRHMWLGSVREAFIGYESDGLYSPGGNSANSTWTPHSTNLDITADLDIRIDFEPDDLTPGADFNMFARHYWSPNDYKSWRLYWHTDSDITLQWSTTGADGLNGRSTAQLDSVFSNGERFQFRVTLDVDNDAGGYDLKFWHRNDGLLGASIGWTQLGATVVGGSTTSIFNPTQAGLTVNGTGSSGATETVENTSFSGYIHRAILMDGIDGSIEFDARFDQEAAGTQSFTESSANAATVTVNQAAGDTNDPRFFPYAGVQYAHIPLGGNNYIWLADSVPLSITGDIEFIVYYEPDDWDAFQSIATKRGTVDSNMSWELFVTEAAPASTIKFAVQHSENGTTFPWSEYSSDLTGIVTNGVGMWFRATIDVDDGASGHRTKLYYSEDPPDTALGSISWTGAGDATRAGTTNIFDSTIRVQISGWGEKANALVANYYRLAIYDGFDGAGTLQLDVDFTDQTRLTEGFDNFYESSSNSALVTIGRDPAGVKTYIIDRNCFRLATDDYLEADDDPVFDIDTGEDMTLVYAGRKARYYEQWPMYITKSDGFGSSQHWHFYGDQGTRGQWVTHFDDGSTNDNPLIQRDVSYNGVPFSMEDSVTFVGGFRYDRSTANLAHTFMNDADVYESESDITGKTTLANALVVRIGANAVDQGFQNGVFIAAAIWKTAKSDADIQTAIDYLRAPRRARTRAAVASVGSWEAVATALTAGPTSKAALPAVGTWVAVAAADVDPGAGDQQIDALPAVGSWEAVLVALTRGAVSRDALSAVGSWEGVTVTPVPGVVSKSMLPAIGSWEGVATTPVPGPLTKAILAAVATWQGVEVTLFSGVVKDAQPAIATWQGVPVVLTPGAVSKAAVAAVATWVGVDVSLTPGATTRDATPAVAAWAGVPVTLDIGAVTRTADPAIATWEGVPVTLVPGAVSKAAQSAVGTWEGVEVGIFTGIVKAALPAVATWEAVATALVKGAVSVDAQPAVGSWEGVPVGLTIGPITVVADPVTGTWQAVATTTALGDVSKAAQAAIATWESVAVGVVGSGAVTAIPAVATWEGVATTPVPGAVSIDSVPAVGNWISVALGTTVGPVSIDAQPATGNWQAVPVTLQPGAISVILSSADGTWSAVPVTTALLTTVSPLPAVGTWQAVGVTIVNVGGATIAIICLGESTDSLVAIETVDSITFSEEATDELVLEDIPGGIKCP